jgi:AAA+ superfamily predicted ATPase
VLNFTLPDDEGVCGVIKNRLATFQTGNLSWPRVVEAARGLSHAEIATAAESAAKRAVLAGRTRILTQDLLTALGERPRSGAAPERAE